MNNVRILEMDHIVLNVADIERSLAFYTGTLGLKGERIDAFREGKVGFPSVRINADTLIDLMEMAPTGDKAARNLNHFCLVCEPTDFGALVQEFRDAGVVVTREPVSRWGAHGQSTSIYILDPDENEVEIRYY